MHPGKPAPPFFQGHAGWCRKGQGSLTGLSPHRGRRHRDNLLSYRYLFLFKPYAIGCPGIEGCAFNLVALDTGPRDSEYLFIYLGMERKQVGDAELLSVLAVERRPAPGPLIIDTII